MPYTFATFQIITYKYIKIAGHSALVDALITAIVVACQLRPGRWVTQQSPPTHYITEVKAAGLTHLTILHPELTIAAG